MGMIKGIHEIIGDLTETVAGDGPSPMAEVAGSVEDMEALLETLSASDPEAASRLAPVLEQARAMNGMMKDIVAAEALGDIEALMALSRDFAALSEVPSYAPETDPEAIALTEALDGEDDAALAAVLDGLGDLNRPLGKYGQTPLCKALRAMGRSTRRVQMLLDRGARADFATDEGYTPLHMIADYPWPGDTPDTLEELTAIVALLVAHGGDLEARTHWGWTPLVSAVFEGSPLEMAALLAAGADPNATVDSDGPAIAEGKSLLILAADEPEKVALLLDHGADVAASGIAAHLAAELAMEDPQGYAPYWDALRASQALVAAARRQ